MTERQNVVGRPQSGTAAAAAAAAAAALHCDCAGDLVAAS